jgi:hypothetical protein
MLRIIVIGIALGLGVSGAAMAQTVRTHRPPPVGYLDNPFRPSPDHHDGGTVPRVVRGPLPDVV